MPLAGISSVQEAISRTESEDPIERIDARIYLIRNFPPGGNTEHRDKLRYRISDDVKTNESRVIDHVSSIPDASERAYVARIVSLGFKIGDYSSDEVVNEPHRKRFVTDVVEPLMQNLNDITYPDARIYVAENVANEGREDLGLMAVDSIWDMGWNTSHPKKTEFVHTIADGLYEIVRLAVLPIVKERALSHLSEIPDNEALKKYLSKVMTLKYNPEHEPIAVRAVDKYVERVDPDKSRVSVAQDAMLITYRNLGSVELPPDGVVARGFELLLGYTPEGERVHEVLECLDGRRGIVLFAQKNKRAPGIIHDKCISYLRDHLDEINSLDDNKKRVNVLWKIAKRGDDEVTIRAIDYLATGLDGVGVVAELFGQRYGFEASSKAKECLGRWAARYTRFFIPVLGLTDKARNVLRNVADDGYEAYFYEEPNTGKLHGEIALEELEKFPKPLTEKEKLEAIFTKAT